MAQDKTARSLIKGFVDAHDSSGRSIYAAFISASAPQRTIYLKEYFTYDALDKSMNISDLAELLEGDDAPHQSDGFLARCKYEFNSFLITERALELGSASGDVKDKERRLARFFAESLEMNAIVFLDEEETDDDGLLAALPSLGADLSEEDLSQQGEEEPAADSDELEADDDDDADEIGAREGEVYLSCTPVLDAVRGTACTQLRPGDYIYVELPKGSFYCQYNASKDPAFTGRTVGEVTGVRVDELGAAVVAVKLADGVYGAVRLAESVKLKVAATREEANAEAPLPRFRPEALFALISIAAFIAVMYIFLFTGR